MEIIGEKKKKDIQYTFYFRYNILQQLIGC